MTDSDVDLALTLSESLLHQIIIFTIIFEELDKKLDHYYSIFRNSFNLLIGTKRSHLLRGTNKKGISDFNVNFFVNFEKSNSVCLCKRLEHNSIFAFISKL